PLTSHTHPALKSRDFLCQIFAPAAGTRRGKRRASHRAKPLEPCFAPLQNRESAPCGRERGRETGKDSVFHRRGPGGGRNTHPYLLHDPRHTSPQNPKNSVNLLTTPEHPTPALRAGDDP